MNRNLVLLTGSFLLAVLSWEANAQEKKDNGKTEKKEDSTSLKKNDSTAAKKVPYDQLLENPTRVSRGLMNLYYVKNKLYMEIPLKLMEKEMLLASTISETSDNYEGLVGSKPTDLIQVYFSLVDSTVLLRKTEKKMVAPATDRNLADALDKNSIGAILKLFPVAAFNNARTTAVIDVTDYFLGDTKELSPFGDFNIYKGMGLSGSQSFKKDRSYIGNIKSFDDNVIIKSHLSYENTRTDSRQRTYQKDEPFTVVMTRTLLLLPPNPTRPRMADSRIGIFTTKKTRLSNEVDRVEPVYYANRWKLEPKDKAAYLRGELVEPIKPITFYVDSDFPESWKKPVKEAINDWNIAFEKIGFKNAVRALDYPKDDPAFDPDNLKYSCVRYAPAPVANAIGPSWVDPRSGEIINASVYLFHDAVKLINNWMFIQTSPANPDLRGVVLPDAYKEEGIKYVVRHEIGHCLGFMHNFAASSSMPVDSLRSPSFTSQYGTTYSIMDYARFNYIAQPGDKEKGVKLSPPLFGLYDYYLVKWNYTYFDSLQAPAVEKAALAKLIADKAGDARYRYGSSQGIDPSVQTEDLGNDAVKASGYGVSNLKYLMAHLNEWVGREDKDYSYRKTIWEGILSQYVAYVNHVYGYVGGIYMNEKYVGDPRPFYLSVSRQQQEAATAWLLNQLHDLDWIEDPSVLSNMTLTGTPMAVLRTNITKALLEAPYKVNLAALKSPEQNPYTPADVLKQVYDAIWKTTADNKTLSTAEREIQKAYVAAAISNAAIINSAAAGTQTALTSSFTPAIQLPGLSSYRAMESCLEQPKGEGIMGEKMTRIPAFNPVAGFESTHINFNRKAPLELLYYSNLKEIKSLLERRVKRVSDNETRAHYKLLLNQIDKVLK